MSDKAKIKIMEMDKLNFLILLVESKIFLLIQFLNQ